MNQKIGNEIIFATQMIPQSQIFLIRKNVYAMVNNRPYLPGHVLVCSRRPVPKLSDLTEIQILDLFMTAQQISNKLGILNQCTYNISLQNGKQAGQTVPHVHLHLCPQKKEGMQARKQEALTRSQEEMTAQASKYKTCFQQSAI